MKVQRLADEYLLQYSATESPPILFNIDYLI